MMAFYWASRCDDLLQIKHLAIICAPYGLALASKFQACFAAPLLGLYLI